MTALTEVDKSAVLAALRAEIARELASAVASQRHAQESAVHEEARPESDKDTRATETSYLARGLAMRVSELTEAERRLAAVSAGSSERVAIGALVLVRDAASDVESHYFVAPAGAGITLEVDGLSIAVITPKAPLCRAMLGKEAGDEIEFKAPRGMRALEIEDIR